MKKAFTLLEVLIVIAIIAILAAIALPNLLRAKEHSAKTESVIQYEGNGEVEIKSNYYYARIGKVKIQGMECVYLIGSNKGGISCDWEHAKIPLGVM